MGSKIHRLDSLTANQIAAGEVIERPVSIIKELLENSIDAGSDFIQVEIRDGGLSYIQVTDNGVGILQEDLPLTIERHATSKLTVIQDLDNLTTLGFRGEAMASIASISATTIISRPKSQDQGLQLKTKGDQIEPLLQTIGSPIGTTIIVEDLFFNTPARKKFMKTPGYEGGLIHDLLIQMSLGYPHITFKLINQDKTILDTAGITTSEDLVELFYGKEARNALVPIQGVVSQAKLNGFITAPPYSRGTRKAIHIFINGRRINSKEIQWAIERGFEYILPKGRFPVASLSFIIPSILLDINVHPGKLEIKINDSQLNAELTKLIRIAISGGQSIPDYSHYGQPNIETSAPQIKANYNQVSFEKHNNYQWQDTYSVPIPADSINLTQRTFDPSVLSEKTYSQNLMQDNFVFGPDMDYQIIGQLHHTFILADTSIGLMIIDQHVAHERVLYEKLIAQHKEAVLPSQMLMTPVSLNLTALEEEVLIKNIMLLNDLGMIIERFGPRCYILRSIPVGQEQINQEFIKDFLEKLSEDASNTNFENVRQSFLIMMSCKAAVKANQPLTIQEMQTLIQQLQKTQHPMTCPHGRPIIYMLPYTRLLRAFGRSS